ncbi:MAG: TIGR03619 family F420-dependent LLM class oxidoreductase [bacterium]|nr:TIGR03619 family F420-dependent LLM class oxidoreductase [bacterium]MDE0439736.1 TIGR03619 family F420-dependent LLM class oxidoreductase [bacterium]
MKYGIGAVNSLLIEDPTAMRDVAQAAEGLGYDFLTLIDHVLLAYPAADGTPRAHYPARTPYHDILVALGYLGGVTTRIFLRSAVVIMPQRGPAVVAKQAAAVDSLSGGRLELGLGIGWHREEYDALEIPFTERGRRMDEGVELMKLLWTQDRVDFDGRYYKVDGMGMEPKPVTQPHPPIWFGGTTPPVFRRVVEHGVGWLSRPVQTIEEIDASWKEILRLAADTGREADALRLHVSVGLGPEETTDRIVANVRRMISLGATDVSFFTSYMPGIETVGDHIAQLERAMTEVVPAARPGGLS